MRGVARSDCHTFKLSLRTPGNAPTASMPADAGSHCIPGAKDLRKLAFVLVLCQWSANFGSLLSVCLKQVISR